MKYLLVFSLGIMAILVASCCDDDNPVTEKAPLFSLTVVDDQGNPVAGLRVGSTNHPKNGGPVLDKNSKPCPQTEIYFILPEASDWELTIQNYFGGIVKTMSGYNEAGNYHIIWDGTDDSGNAQVSGYYHYNVTAGPNEFEQWMILELGPDPHQTIIGALNGNGQFITNDTLLFPGLLGNPPVDYYTDTVTLHLSNSDFPDDFFYYTTRLSKAGNGFRFTLDSLNLP